VVYLVGHFVVARVVYLVGHFVVVRVVYLVVCLDPDLVVEHLVVEHLVVGDLLDDRFVVYLVVAPCSGLDN
jgi:hypothetical protein